MVKFSFVFITFLIAQLASSAQAGLLIHERFNALPLGAPPASFGDQVRLLWIPLNRPATFNLLNHEFQYRYSSKFNHQDSFVTPSLTTIKPDIDYKNKRNPFKITNEDFLVGDHLPNAGSVPGPVPDIDAVSAKWFDEIVDANQLPEVFLIGGHHVISEGWHNDPESGFLYMPKLLDTLNQHVNARKIFSSVKLAILWGCNTMTNLEPHGKNGEYLDSASIQTLFEKGGKDREAMLGTEDKINSLSFYKSRLAREYGPSNKKHYDYTLDAAEERCKGPGKYDNCSVTNLNRIMPDEAIYGAEHIYNEPARMKLLFPNAYLILGFSSASPSEETRRDILEKALDDTRKELRLSPGVKAKDQSGQVVRKDADNLLYTIIDESTLAEVRALYIQTLRRNWTLETYKMNRERPSGSITPALPELDQGKVFNVSSKEIPGLDELNGQYEQRN